MVDDFFNLEIREQALAELHTAVNCAGSGRTVVLQGEDSAGRGRTLLELCRRLKNSKPKTIIVGLKFTQDARIVPLDSDDKPKSAISAGLAVAGAAGTAAAVAPILSPGLIVLALAAQVAQAAADIGVAVEGIRRIRQTESEDPASDLLRLIRGATRSARVICVIDGYHYANTLWWRQFLRDSSPELAELPFVLVVGIGEQAFGGMSVPVKMLCGVEDATIIQVDKVLRKELERILAQISPELAEDILLVSAGHAGWVRSLWIELTELDAIENSDAGWRWTPGVIAKPSSYLGLVRELVDLRIRQSRLSDRESDLFWSIVRLAALEGVVFTPEAAVRAAGIIGLEGFEDIDEVLDAIDDWSDPALREHRIFRLHETGLTWQYGPETRYAYTAEFRCPTIRAAVLRFGLSSNDKQRWSDGLVRSLEEVYKGNTARIADQLARLRLACGRDDIARSSARMRSVAGGVLMPGTQLNVHASRLDHILNAESWLIASDLKYFGDPKFSLELARRAFDAATRASHPQLMVDSLSMMVKLLRAAQLWSVATPHAERAMSLSATMGPGTRWLSSFQLASCHLGQYDCKCGIPHAALAREISSDLVDLSPDEDARLTSFSLHGTLTQKEGDHLGAISIFRAVVNDELRLGSSSSASTTLVNLAYSYVELRQHSAAEKCLRQALAIRQELGDQYGLVRALHELAYISMLRGALRDAQETACDCFIRAIRLGVTGAARHELVLLTKILRKAGDIDKMERVGSLLAEMRSFPEYGAEYFEHAFLDIFAE